jgi:trehalose/maltose hydrolase-like predicted phosphorylase
MATLTLPVRPAETDDLPPELCQPFRIIAFDWDGTAVAGRQEAAGPLRDQLERLLRLGVSVAVITGTNFPNIDRQFSAAVQGPHKRRLFVLTNRGSEVYGFDRASRPILLWNRSATPEEDRLLTEVADAAREALVARTGLDARVIHNRLNRRKIDLIPLPEWDDPPKSALGELLEAVEGRLRGAGLCGGLHEAIALVEQVARDRGLRDARVTSDVKHIEVGLTDKADSINWVMRELARRQGIPPGGVLIVGDEFGAPGRIEGSDHKMMTAQSRGAVVVSVGPEPAGVPEGVIHLHGGPARFRELLRAQVAAQQRAERTPHRVARAVSADLPAVPTGDPDWLLVEEGFCPAREQEIESLFTTSNGYVGTRGSLAEGGPSSSPAVFVAGVFGIPETPGAVPELARAPDWTHLRVVANGYELTLEGPGTVEHRRVLDLHQGILWREWRYQDPQGRITRLRFLRMASLADRHVLLQSVTLTPENYSGELLLESRFAAGPGPVSFRHITPGRRDTGAADALVLKTRAPGGGEEVALTGVSALVEDGDLPLRQEVGVEQGSPVQRWRLEVEPGKTHRLDRLACVYTSRDAREPGEAALAHLDRLLVAGGVPEAVEAHRGAWAEQWQAADVRVEGDAEAQKALRFAAYHLVSAANPEDERASVGARALTGEAYKGHVFWDTDIYLLPFYTFAHPSAARAQLMYRYHTLPAARAKARSLGYRGALYAWESAGDGQEATPSTVVGPDRSVIRLLCGEQEQHISADVAYAVWHYWQATGDDDFYLQAGAEILLETARFWASRLCPGSDGLYHIAGVIGPDEYHESVDDNAYTNGMARWNLERGADAVRLLRKRWPRRGRELLARLGLDPAEPARWQKVAGKVYTGLDPRTGLIEQFRGYFGLELVDPATYEPRTVPMDVILGRERTQRSQVVKQADAVLLLGLLWEDFPPEVREANFRYYEPRTGHGSSLSSVVHALVAARLGDTPLAERYFGQAARVDLANGMGNAAGGVHMATLGGLWQATVLGFAGMQVRPDGLVFAPSLPRCWRRLRFPVCWRGRRLRVEFDGERGVLGVSLAGSAGMTLAISGGPEVAALPGRRYATRRTKAGWGAWQEEG